MSSVRLFAQVPRNARAFSTSVTRRDLVQQLYVRELKAYKAPPPPKDAHVGNVKLFTPPAPLKAPVLPADLAADLTAYDATEPTKAEVEAVKSTGALEGQTGGGPETFLAFLEADVKPAEAHH